MSETTHMGNSCCCEAPTVVYRYENANSCIMRPMRSPNATGRSAAVTRDAPRNVRDNKETANTMINNCVRKVHLMARHIPIVDANTVHRQHHNPLRRQSSSPSGTPRAPLMPRTSVTHDSWPRSLHTSEVLTPREQSNLCDRVRQSMMLGSGVSSLAASSVQQIQILGDQRSVDEVIQCLHVVPGGFSNGDAEGSPVFPALPLVLPQGANMLLGESPVAVAS
ncbi:Hypothetical protein, putative [Bodo saltans]|uniref:Uncharacterized protein n=1 Tax=Bodo saltans TaxID=75058 RepID=A0A0S4J848_BODSA|nr:Hypothetical protein, putative [Bodo saltans]|eukprot:CUG86347.1 Hypothetical protein, putative [Bodo saltans]